MDLERAPDPPLSGERHEHGRFNENGCCWNYFCLAYKTLGVIFGGLVTSPLYVYPSMNLNMPDEDDYLGIYSIIFWTLTMIGVVKYICIALNADDQGEGGTFALYSLLCRHANIGLIPSGHESANSPHSQSGRAESRSRLGKYFEQSFNARRVLLFVAMLGMCMLIGDGLLTPAISGAEAMFADLGHFNKRSIQMAFLLTIYPSLVLTYAGKTTCLIKNPNSHENGFYNFIPSAVYWPMFIIATLAVIVASQSLISATFSVIKQSVFLYYFPCVRIVHTSSNNEGEVYSPEVNYILMFLCVAVIVGFGDGKDISNAFGAVVILVMLITTLLLTLVMIIIWRTPITVVGLYFISFLILEGVYVSAVFTKFSEGGWIPFAISLILAFIMFGWYYGRQSKMEYELNHKITLDSLSVMLSNSDIQRVPGLCLFYSDVQGGLTPVLGHYIKNMRSLHTVTIFTTLRYLLVAKVPQHE